MAIARVIRARLFGIIAARVVVSTLLLGSAVAIGLSNPDTFPAAPFAYLIALTFALSLGYLATMQRALRAQFCRIFCPTRRTAAPTQPARTGATGQRDRKGHRRQPAQAPAKRSRIAPSVGT
jgi:hypothetical protein